MFNAYEHMKSKHKKEYDNMVHWTNLTNSRISMFEYKGLPDTLRPELMESLLMTQGTCGIGEYKGDLYTGTGGYTGQVVNYIPEDYFITLVGMDESTIRGKAGKEIAVGWNNAIASPDWLILQASNILTEIDVSERANVLFARYIRIPKVSDQKEKVAVEASIKAIVEGRVEAIVSDNVKNILTDEPIENQFLDLVDVKNINCLQYLNQYRDNIIKRYYQTYGMGMNPTSKMAQQSVEEINSGTTVSMIIPLTMLAKRKQWVDDINRIFGTNITVDFSEAWRDSHDEMIYKNSDGSDEVAPEDERSEEDGETNTENNPSEGNSDTDRE